MMVSYPPSWTIGPGSLFESGARAFALSGYNVSRPTAGIEGYLGDNV